MTFSNGCNKVVAEFNKIEGGWILHGLKQSFPLKTDGYTIEVMKRLGYNLVKRKHNRSILDFA